MDCTPRGDAHWSELWCDLCTEDVTQPEEQRYSTRNGRAVMNNNVHLTIESGICWLGYHCSLLV